MKDQNGVIPDAYTDLLVRPLFAHMATIQHDGSPQVNPVWVRWDGTFLWFTLTSTRQRYKNLLRDPRVAVSIIDPDDPYRYLEVRGQVERVDPDPGAQEFRRLAGLYHVAVDGRPADAPRRLAAAVRPSHVSCQGGLPRFGPRADDASSHLG